MSRFSRSDAEAAGWVIVHEREEHEVIEAGQQGRVQKIPGSYRAEKILVRDGQENVKIEEHAESIGKLLEQINAREENYDKLQIERRNVEIDLDSLPKNESGYPIRTVGIAKDPGDLSKDAEMHVISDADLASLRTQDAGYDEDGNAIVTGPSEEVVSAVEAHAAAKRAVEERRTAQKAVGPSTRLDIDENQTIKSPGATAHDALGVLEGEETLAEVSARHAARKQQAENARVAAQFEQGDKSVAPEGAEKLVGTDVSMSERSDVGEALPRRDVYSLEENEEVPGSTLELQREEEQARMDVAVEAAEEHGSAADKEDIRHETRDEIVERVQEVHDEQSEKIEDRSDEPAPMAGYDPDKPEKPVATDAAKALARKKRVALKDIKGTGKNGRITVGDVEAHLEKK